MQYLEFYNALRIFPVFSVQDIRKQFPEFDSRRLVEWQQKGYIIKVRRGFYCFKDQIAGESFLYYAANKIYSPSYLSLESALSFYGLIPEAVFTATSITTRNTAHYETAIGSFDFKHFKPGLFFGYKMMRDSGLTIKIAEPEKLILDFFYINILNSVEDIKEIRFNGILAEEIIDWEKLKRYQGIFNSRILDKRIRLFSRIVNARFR